MPYLTLMRISGDPDDLLARKQETMDPVTTRVAPENGGILHLAAKTGDGLLLVNLWESKAGSDAMFEHPEVQRARQKSGLAAEQIQVEHYEVEQFIQPSS